MYSTQKYLHINAYFSFDRICLASLIVVFFSFTFSTNICISASPCWHQCCSCYPLIFSSTFSFFSDTHRAPFIHTMKNTDLQHTITCIVHLSSATTSRPVAHSGSCFTSNSSTTVTTTVVAHNHNFPAEYLVPEL